MKNCVVVLGMHRSGTSAVMGALNKMGLPLGHGLMMAKDDNPKGFFENNYIVEKNDEILKVFHNAWDRCFDLPEDWRRTAEVRHIFDALTGYLAGEFANEEIFGLKDPRLCLLIPLWLDLFRNSKIEPVFILPLRHPVEVAMSLAKRNGFSMEKSLLLWQQYSLLAEQYTRGYRRVFLSFEQLLTEPDTILGAALKQLELDHDFGQYINRSSEGNCFIERSMKHNSSSEVEIDCWQNILATYEALIALGGAGADASPAILANLDNLREEFKQLRSLFYNADQRLIGDKYVQISFEVEELRRQAGILNAQLKRSFIDNENLEKRYQLLNGQLRNSIVEKEKLKRRYQADGDALQRENAALRKVLAQHEAELITIRQTLAWKMLQKYNMACNRFFPEETARRKAYNKLKNAGKIFLDNGFAGLARRTRQKAGIGIEKTKPLIQQFPPSALQFQRDDEPQVSIIIPVYNNLRFTYDCLKSISQHTSGLYEVIIVDNNSTDDTPELLNLIDGLRVISNHENKVFVEGCKQGASIAKGKYLLFLNNDTEVTRNWLSELLIPFEDPSVGIVGAKLIYPDGLLQEAGGIIWQDGNGWNYGHGDDPNLPRYCYRKEVDYCSGACLCIRKDIWDEIGGFDERYAPAYYEDTDLCFAARAAGYKVIFQPEAKVIHYGGASAGKDTSSGYKRYQDINREKFVEKWRQVLLDDHFPGPAFLNQARERGKSKWVMVIDHYVPLFDQDSGSLRMSHILSILAELNYKVVFWPDNGACNPKYVLALQEQGIEVMYGTQNFESYIKEHGDLFDTVIMSRPYIVDRYLYLVKKYSKAKTIYDTVDLHFLREQRKAELDIENLRRLEFHLADNCDTTLVVSPAEKELLCGEKFGHKVKVLSNIHQLEKAGNSFYDRSGGIFIGGFDHPPNVNGIIWFVSDILPMVKERIPDFRLTIIGSNPPPSVRALASEDIEVTGFVEDVTDYFNEARVFVCPLLYGAGVKGKIGHSFSYGLPVVTTEVGAEGMQLQHRLNAMISSSAEQFADDLVELYGDENLWQTLSINCRTLIEKNYSRELVKETLQELIG